MKNILYILLFAPLALFGQEVKLEKASHIAFKFINSDKANPSVLLNKFNLDTTITNSLGENVMYIFNIDTVGFIMVTGDYRMKPIVSYGMEGRLFDKSKIIPPLQLFFDGTIYEYDNLKDTDLINPEWKKIEESTLQNHSAFYLMSTIWDQNCYYNNYCPEIPDDLIDDLFDWLGGSDICDRALTGCVATALGQIAKYWNYPNTGSYSIGYNDDNLGYVGADFSSGYYDWINMPNELSFWGSTGTQDNAVAKLLYHIGVATHMNYGELASGTNIIAALYGMTTFFNYSNTMDVKSKSEYSNSSWEDLMRNQLDSSLPVFYGGIEPSSPSGHAYVIDGYSTSNLFHHNFGWGGSNNGYYYLSQWYSENQSALINIFPRLDYDFSIYDQINCSNCSEEAGVFSLSEESSIININTRIAFFGNESSYIGNIGCGVTSHDSNNFYIIEEYDVDFNEGYNYYQTFSNPNLNIPVGEYDIKFYYTNNDANYLIGSGISNEEFVDIPGNNNYTYFTNLATLNITSSVDIPEMNNVESNKVIIKTFDLLGRETNDKPFTPLIDLYDDGSFQKRIILE